MPKRTVVQAVHLRGVFGSHFDVVWLDGRILSPVASQKVFNHSPDGFAWGYGGSGPSQLALAILLKATDDELYAVRNHQDFKRRVIEPLDFGKDFDITVVLPPRIVDYADGPKVVEVPE